MGIISLASGNSCWRGLDYYKSKHDKILAQMTDEERANRIKYNSVDSMREFSKWYKKQNLCKQAIS